MDFTTNTGQKLHDLVENGKVLLVFLRHFGCSFCRETMADLANIREKLQGQDIELILVHMASEELADRIFEVYELDGIQHISDPDRILYSKFGLKQVSMRALASMQVWIKNMRTMLRGHVMGKPVGDPLQMPGLFFFQNNNLLDKFIYRCIGDRPDYLKFVSAAAG